MEIVTKDLPIWVNGRNKGSIRWANIIGREVEINHKTFGRIVLKVVNYKKGRIWFDYKGYIHDIGISVGNFKKGMIGGIINYKKPPRNSFELKDNGILYINGENSSGKWVAIYSGNHLNEVMNSSWYDTNNAIVTGDYNNTGNRVYLHHVEIKPKNGNVVDHISNLYNLKSKYYDNRIENLREVTRTENNKNKKSVNPLGYTGLRSYSKGWLSSFRVNNINIFTKARHKLDEAILDNLIAQKYLGFRHQEEEFYKLDNLSDERVYEVTNVLDAKIKHYYNKIYEIKEYSYNIKDKEDYYIVTKNNHELFLDVNKNYLKNKLICKSRNYWDVVYIDNNKKIKNSIHRDILGIMPNEYKEYNLHVDHLNKNASDNRIKNLAITTSYSNSCNLPGKGYFRVESGSYQVQYIANYKFFNIIGSKIKTPTFKTEQEAIDEVNRRRKIIDNARVKLSSKEELDELIKYCLDNGYTQKNGLANLDLGYLYWKGIIK